MRLGVTLCMLPLIAAEPSCFRDVAPEAGIRFVLENGASPAKHLIETMPGGIAVFDYDNDGLLDIYFTNGAAVPSLEKDSPKFWNRLFRNEGKMKFRDVTAEAGVAGAGYSTGVAAADFDNDGDVDLLVTGVRRNLLYRNNGMGRFEDITSKSGIASGDWTVSAAWVDVDNDGLLDLFLANYGSWDPTSERFCGDASRKLRVYCHPKYYAPRPNQLYRNRGDGTFEDVSTTSGISAQKGRAMGVGLGDYDRDGRIDIFVTNDNLPNFLFHNEGKGKFREVALAAGVALLDSGKPVASMGTDFRDYDNDGWPDIIVTALPNETYPLFRNLGNGSFVDATHRSKLAPLTAAHGGWGAVLADFDNDGWKDLFTSNSHVNDLAEQFEPSRYKQANTLFRNTARGEFAAASCAALAASAKAHRGLAAGDLDGDGRLDLVVSALGEAAEVWRNTSAGPQHWLSLKLQGIRSNRDGIGAVVRIGAQMNHLNPYSGYASSSLTPMHFGLGALTKVDRLEVLWPSGAKQTLTDVAADQVIIVREPASIKDR